MNLNKVLATKNECYIIGTKMTPRGILVHSTGANNPKLSRYVQPDDGKLGVNNNNTSWNQFRPDGRQVCVHAFIGKLADGSVATYQTLPWDMKGWHSGVGSLGKNKNANNTGYIGFEICEDGLNDREYFNAIYKEATEFCAYLCKLYSLNPMKDGVILCHSEAHKRGIASNHADVMHWFPKHGKNMNTFRQDVAKLLGTLKPANDSTNSSTQLSFKVNDIVDFKGNDQYSSATSIKPVNAKASRVKITRVHSAGKHPYHVRSVNAQGNFISGVYGWVDAEDLVAIDKEVDGSFSVKVTENSLNIRSGPSITYRIVGAIEDKGVYTIVEESNGWGKLKSKVGWINLSYTRKLK